MSLRYEAPGDFHVKNPDSIGASGDNEMCISVTPKLRLSSLSHYSSQKVCINKK